MKGRRRELNYPFDPAAVSDPACWLPRELGDKIGQRFGLPRDRGEQAMPVELRGSLHLPVDDAGQVCLPEVPAKAPEAD